MAQVLNKSRKAVIHSVHVLMDISGYMSIPTNLSVPKKLRENYLSFYGKTKIEASVGWKKIAIPTEFLNGW